MRRAILTISLLAACVGQGWGLGFLVTPPRFELLMTPGQSKTYTLSVVNTDSASTLRLKAMVMDWTMKPNGQTAYPRPGTLFQSCTRWIEVNPAEFEVAPGMEQLVRFTVIVPDSTFGSYWSMIYFESQPDTAQQAMIGIVMKARVGSAVYVTIQGTEVRQAELTGFSYRRKDAGNHEYRLQVKNTGNVHLRPKGSLLIRSADNTAVATLAITDELVLPGAQRDLVLPLAKVLAPGRYTAVINLDCGTPELIQGETAFEVAR
jgi:P pilus assembly chaperone PapD